MKRTAVVLFAVLSCTSCRPREDSLVLFITQDGLRWQEVFSGADETLIGEKDQATRKAFIRPTAEERRQVLMPFLWTTVARQGQIFGNRTRGSYAQVTNGRKFSYPGYNELLTGAPDPRIDSNDKIPNPNVSVLEWLDHRPGFEDMIAAFGTWELLPYILNRQRSGLPIVAANDPIRDEPLTARQAFINELKRDTAEPWAGNPFDSFFFYAALEHMKRHPARVLYVMFGETDEWAHEGKYAQYLQAIRRTDGFVQRLWEAAQEIAPGHVSLLFTTDHGRGDGPEWKDHGEKIEGAENVWIGVTGPKVAALGERSSVPPVTSSQVAATVAALAGEDYAGAVSSAAKPIELH